MTIMDEMITLDVNGNSTSAYVALPQGDGPWPGVVVIQEWWGLEEHIKDVARRFASEGFVAIAPDLYYGEIATEPDEAQKLLMALDWDKALTAIQVAIDTLAARPEVLPKRVGVIGFCMGGGLAWHAAAKLERVGAAAPFYGGGPEMSNEEVAQIDCPVLAIYGELDEGVSPEVANQRAAQMDKAGVQHETIIYPDAEHAFFNDTRDAYNAEATTDAWQRVLNLFKQTLRPGASASEAWIQVGEQFRALGESLASAFGATWQSEESRQHLEKMQADLEAMVREIRQISKRATTSEEVQKVRAEAEKAAQSARTAGQATVEEMRPQLLSALRKVREELNQMIDRMEQQASDKTTSKE